MTTEQQKLSRDEHMAIVFQSYGMCYAISKMAQIDTSHERMVELVNHMLLVGHLDKITDEELQLFESAKLEDAADLIGRWTQDFDNGRI